MSTEESIFNANGETSPNAVEPTTFSIPTEVSELVGEGKKYKTTEEALKALPHAQSHIQKLEEEARSMKEELSRRKAVEEVLAEFKATPNSQSMETPSAQLDEAKLAQLVEQVVEKKKAVEVAKANTSNVVSKMVEKFGDKAEQEFIRVAAENGMTVPFLNSLAARAPEAVLKLAGITMEKELYPNKTNSTVNTQAFNNNQLQEQSARVGFKGSTKDLVAAWKVAGEKVKAKQS